jgi:F-box-like
VIRIDVLPDDILIEIFDFYVDVSLSYEGKKWIEAWQSLAHVCRRWRSVVLGSPRRLKLQLYCTPETPVRDTLDVWPAFPLLVRGNDMSLSASTDNVIAALGQSNRVCEIILLGLTGRQLEEVLAPMQVPFPELTDLQLWTHDKTPPVIPDSFLDGSAPRLRIFRLDGIPFPGLPKLLLSATHLVQLLLTNIPHSGYLSPEAIVAPLSVLPSLEVLSLELQSPESRPDWGLPPPKRSILPALNVFYFSGVTEYLEELVTRIDTPQLDTMDLTFFNQIDFACPRLAQFINCTPTLKALDEAHVQFTDGTASIIFRYQTNESGYGELLINILCREPDWQLSSIEQVCNSSLHPLSMVEDLYIEHEYSELVWKDDAIENTLWLQLLLPFTAVKNLYLSKDFAPGIAAALQELAGGITEVLSSLQNIFVEGLEPSGPFQKNIGQFVAARQLSDYPIAISDWDKDTDTDMESM